MAEQEQTKEKTEKTLFIYDSIKKDIEETIYKLPKAYTWGGLRKEHATAPENLTQKLLPKIEMYANEKAQQYKAKTSELTEKVKNCEEEKQKLEKSNTEHQNIISELETNLNKVQAEYATIKKRLLDFFSVEELKSESYRRGGGEESITQAEAEDGTEEPFDLHE